MAGKGERTRTMVVERAARLFNQRGYHGLSISDVLEATGLEKGGLYNHFGSKDQLAVEAFDHSVALVAARLASAVEDRTTSIGKLEALVDAFAGLFTDPVVPGGCPIMNTAIESVDTHPELRDRAREAMTSLQRLVGSILKEGVRTGELRRDADPRRLASIVTAHLEGALMLSRLFDDGVHLRNAVAHCKEHIRTFGRTR